MGFSGAGMEEEYYGSRDVLEGVFGGANTIQKMMDVEAALAWAECRAGLVPEQYAGEIQEKCSVKLLDEAVYTEARRTTGHPLMGMLRAYKAICSKEAGEYLHYGATTQDISDTALILQLREAWDIVEDKTRRLREILSGKAREYRSLVMIGRTNDQQAMPITLGFKISTWIDELDRCLERMEQGRERIFVGQFAGAVGTMASLEQEGPRVQKLLLERLGLAAPKISWFATRDRLAEFTFDLAMICGAVGRMGNEVYNEQRSEVNELAEGYALGKVGSSTMPHKRNPFLPGRLAGRGRIAGTLVMRAMQCLENTNERDCRTLCIEPYHLKEICCLADGTLDIALELFGQMEVHEDQIGHNLEILQGLIYSEALMMRLAEVYGRMEAHELVYELAMAAIAQKRQLKELALADSRVTAHLTEEELENLMRPEHYTGLAEHFVDQVAGTE
ncbi:class-II fumarase/aspartase family protein [Enterocloster lavalensis]|uniref:class-II fumarase/aspartase family protein n=1 Tax=Enterocloster lavalensis TaxID=460384 RepID=UPI001D06D7AE|nr:adenylosuccinate lyase family protein [Enterocloster lavalensis]MCB6345332.1 adenylosuccinate lyase family protein [Enterocloster lavalensis]